MHVDNDPPLNNIIVSRLNGILVFLTHFMLFYFGSSIVKVLSFCISGI